MRHVARGEALALAVGDEDVGELAMRSWGEARTIRATVIRDIMSGSAGPRVRELELAGARISGRLELQYLETDMRLLLSACLLEGGLDVTGARLSQLVLIGCRIEHPAEPPLMADLFNSDGGLFLGLSVVEGHCDRGAVSLVSAHVGSLDCEGATLANDAGPAFEADGLRADRSVSLADDFSATGVGHGGAVRLAHAHIGGHLHCTAVSLHNGSGPALSAQRLRVDNDVFLSGTFIGMDEFGAVRLVGAQLGGLLEIDGASIRNDSGPALMAERLQVADNMFLRGDFTADWNHAAVRLSRAHIGGDLNCLQATLTNASGSAFDGDMLKVDLGFFFREGSAAIGAGSTGAMNLMGAMVGDQMDLARATLTNATGPCLVADSIQVKQHITLAPGFVAHGASDLGAIRLLGARVGGQLDCSGATIVNETGPGLVADSIQVGTNILLRNGFSARGGDGGGAVRLVGAHVGGTLEINDASAINDGGSALVFEQLTVDQSMFLIGRFEGGGDAATANLRDVSVGSTFILDARSLTHADDPHALLVLDGLAYPGVPVTGDTGDWLSLIRAGTRTYAGQPYQQLAVGHRGLGHDREARLVLMSQRRDQIERGVVAGKAERAWVRITGITLGYGYQPWRALLFLLAITAVAVLLALTLGPHGALARAGTDGVASEGCSSVERIGVGLDMALPLVKTHSRDWCDVTGSTIGQILMVAGWLVQLFAWAFATLFIAGFTSAVRRT